MPSSDVSVHIPAWRRVGLTLKSHPQQFQVIPKSIEHATTSDGVNISAQKRRTEELTTVNGGSWPSERLAKRHKQVKEDSGDLVLNGVTELNKLLAKHLPESSPKPIDKSLQKRKSVSFGPEVKAEDGDSVNHYRRRRNSIAHAQAFDSSPPTIQAKKPRKKKDRSNTTKLSSSDSPSARKATQHYLTYLTAYHTSLSEWKFSKRHQNNLLKHLLSLDEVPSEYDSALISYLQGLKGLDARQRIREQALKIREEDDSWLRESDKNSNIEPSGNDQDQDMDGQHDPDRQRRREAAYEAEVTRMKKLLREKAYDWEDKVWERCGGLEELDARWRKRKRAEAILWAIGEASEQKERVYHNGPTHADQLEQQRQHRLSRMEVSTGGGNSWMLGRDAGRLNGGISRPAGKKIIFGDDGATVKTETIFNGSDRGQVNGETASGAVNGHRSPKQVATSQGKKPRKRRAKKRTGVPDDDDTSSSSSSDSDSEAKAIDVPKPVSVEKQGLEREPGSKMDTSSSGSSDDPAESSSEDDSDSEDSGDSGE